MVVGGKQISPSARARYDEQAAQYREQVLVAFREVEDNLADLRLLNDQKGNQSEAKLQHQDGQSDFLKLSMKRGKLAIWKLPMLSARSYKPNCS